MKLRIRPLLLPLVACLALAACPNPFDPDDGPVHVRFENASAVPMESVETAFVDGVGTLAPGEATPYVEVETAYRYTYFSAVVEGRRLVLQPIDYVGETPLRPGRYTYVIVYHPEDVGPGPYGGLQILLREDG